MGANDGYTALPGQDVETGSTANPPSSSSPSPPPHPMLAASEPQTGQWSAKYPQAPGQAAYTPPIYDPSLSPNIPFNTPHDPETIAFIPSILPHINPSSTIDPSANPFAKADRQLRHGFLRKVLGLVSLQLLLTVVIATAISLSPPLRSFLSNGVALIVIVTASILTLLPLICCEAVRHSYPSNLILLFTFTLAESLLVGLITCQYETNVVLAALGITTFITISLTLFALQNKVDLTTSGSLLFGLLIAMFFIPILGPLLHLKFLQSIYAGAGAVLFSVYIVFDVQMVAGKGRLAVSPDDYIPAAINIYLDIINLFIKILQLLGSDRN